MGYNFFQKFPIMKALESERLVKRAIKLKWGGERYYQESRSAGLSFRKQDVLYDYRRAAAIEQSKSLTAKGKAAAWFDTILSPQHGCKELFIRVILLIMPNPFPVHTILHFQIVLRIDCNF